MKERKKISNVAERRLRLQYVYYLALIFSLVVHAPQSGPHKPMARSSFQSSWIEVLNRLFAPHPFARGLFIFCMLVATKLNEIDQQRILGT